jgi:DnaK suppressor protein
MTSRNHSAVPSNRPKASTQQIIGGFNTAPKVPAKWKQQFNLLVALRDSLQERKDDLAESAKEEQPFYSLHMADAGTDQYDQDFALSMMSSEQNAIYEIEQALNRMHNGTYGVCELTGESIEPERLAAIPWTRFSMAAQKQLEDSGSFALTKLAQRASMVDTAATEEEEEDEE